MSNSPIVQMSKCPIVQIVITKYEPLRMPFGPKGAPGIFATAMQQTFQDLYPTGWFGQYFDDLTVAANSEQELLSRLVMVFERIKAKKLTVKLIKCDWNKKIGR